MASWSIQPFGHNRHGPKIGGAVPPPFFGEGAGFPCPIYHKVAWAEAYLHNKWHLDASSSLATIEMGWKLEGLYPLFGEEELGPHLAQCVPDRGPPPCQVPSWSIQPFGHNRHGPKTGGSAPFWGGGAGSPSNTISLGPRPTSLPSGILIHPAIWPKQIWAEIGGLCPFEEGELGPHLIQCGQGGVYIRAVRHTCSLHYGHSRHTHICYHLSLYITLMYFISRDSTPFPVL